MVDRPPEIALATPYIKLVPPVFTRTQSNLSGPGIFSFMTLKLIMRMVLIGPCGCVTYLDGLSPGTGRASHPMLFLGPEAFLWWCLLSEEHDWARSEWRGVIGRCPVLYSLIKLPPTPRPPHFSVSRVEWRTRTYLDRTPSLMTDTLIRMNECRLNDTAK